MLLNFHCTPYPIERCIGIYKSNHKSMVHASKREKYSKKAKNHTCIKYTASIKKIWVYGDHRLVGRDSVCSSAAYMGIN